MNDKYSFQFDHSCIFLINVIMNTPKATINTADTIIPKYPRSF